MRVYTRHVLSPAARTPRHQKLLNHGANRNAFRHSHGIRVVQSYVLFDVKEATGNVVHWAGEMNSPGVLKNAGWNKNTLKAGDQIHGYPPSQ